MIEWMTAHPWMMFTVLLVLAAGVSLKLGFVAHVHDGAEGSTIGMDTTAPGPITPDEAREHMLTPSQLAAKLVRDQVERFCEEGNADVAMTLLYDAGDKAVIAELLKYRKAGWNVAFHRDYATMSLPAVLS